MRTVSCAGPTAGRRWCPCRCSGWLIIDILTALSRRRCPPDRQGFVASVRGAIDPHRWGLHRALQGQAHLGIRGSGWAARTTPPGAVVSRSAPDPRGPSGKPRSRRRPGPVRTTAMAWPPLVFPTAARRGRHHPLERDDGVMALATHRDVEASSAGSTGVPVGLCDRQAVATEGDREDRVRRGVDDPQPHPLAGCRAQDIGVRRGRPLMRTAGRSRPRHRPRRARPWTSHPCHPSTRVHPAHGPVVHPTHPVVGGGASGGDEPTRTSSGWYRSWSTQSSGTRIHSASYRPGSCGSSMMSGAYRPRSRAGPRRGGGSSRCRGRGGELVDEARPGLHRVLGQPGTPSAGFAQPYAVPVDRALGRQLVDQGQAAGSPAVAPPEGRGGLAMAQVRRPPAEVEVVVRAVRVWATVRCPGAAEVGVGGPTVRIGMPPPWESGDPVHAVGAAAEATPSPPSRMALRDSSADWAGRARSPAHLITAEGTARRPRGGAGGPSGNGRRGRAVRTCSRSRRSSRHPHGVGAWISSAADARDPRGSSTGGLP